MQDQTTQTVPRCPQGCLDPAGHEYDGLLADDMATRTRFHTFHIGGDVSVHQEEYNREGTVTLFPPHVFLSDDRVGEYTAGQARQFAAEILNAADRLDEIAGAGR